MHKHHREVDADIATGETRIVGTLTGQTGLPLGAIDPDHVQKALEIVGTSYPLKNPVKPDDIYAPVSWRNEPCAAGTAWLSLSRHLMIGRQRAAHDHQPS